MSKKEKPKRDNSSGSAPAKKIAIVGLPNTGKSQVFNNLTGEYTLVANYPLTTVEMRRTRCRIDGETYEVIDTPGLHCLYIHSQEELAVRDMIFKEAPDIIVQCIDANQLKQSLTEGQCCKNSSRTAQSSVVPMVELEVGRSARVAYINCKSDQQLHRIDSLRIRPGAVVTLHQRYPTYVVECEGSNIAMGEEIVSNICVWREPDHLQSQGKETLTQQGGKRRGWGRFKHKKADKS